MKSEEAKSILRGRGFCGFVAVDDEATHACIMPMGHDDGAHEPLEALSPASLAQIIFRNENLEDASVHAIQEMLRRLQKSSEEPKTPTVSVLASWQRTLGSASAEGEWDGVTRVIVAIDEVVREHTRTERVSASKLRASVPESSRAPLPSVIVSDEAFQTEPHELTKVGF